MKFSQLAAPLGLAISLIVIGLGFATVLQGESPSTWLLRSGYAMTGAFSLSVILVAWTTDLFDVDSRLSYPDAGDTHQFLDADVDHHGAPIDLGYLGETEAASDSPVHYVSPPEPTPVPMARPRSNWPFMAFDIPPQRSGESHDDYRRRLAEGYALTFPVY